MEDEQKFCNNCKRNVAARNFVSHIAYCERKLQLCRLCDEPVPREELEDHLNESHTLEHCTLCKVPIERWKLDSHQKDECSKRQVNCKYCELSKSFDSISEHEESCGSRTDKCSSCNGRFLLKEREAHLKACRENNAIKTLLMCTYCEAKFPVENYHQHVKSCVFRSERCLTCGDLVRLKDLKGHGNLCGKENQQQTSYICKDCDQKFTWKEFQNHQSYCRARFKICRHCHETVQISNLDDHLDICQKVRRREPEPSCRHCGKNFSSSILEKHESNCESRCEKCPSCNNFVTYKNVERHKEVCGQIKIKDTWLSCEHCEKKYPLSILELHQPDCEFRLEKCGFCNEYVKCKDLEDHRKTCGQIKQRDPEIACEHCEKKFPSSILERHEAQCELRYERCASCHECVRHKFLDHHRRMCQQARKDPEFFECKHCEKKYPSNILEHHESQCEFRHEKCALCHEYVQSKDLDDHRKMCGQAKKYSTAMCEHCGERIPVNVLEEHEYKCDFRSKKCPVCNVAVKIKDMDHHRSSCEQDKRNDLKHPCGHCGEKFPSNIFEHHESKCDLRIEKCSSCYEYVKYKDLEYHMKTCGQVKKYYKAVCKNCDNQIPIDMLEEHKSTCEFRKCPLCNVIVKVMDIDDHRCTYPNMKKYPIATCEYCGVKIPVKILENHELNCEFRCKKCPSCDAVVKAKDMDDHRNFCDDKMKECTKVACEHCSKMIPAHRLEDHVDKCDFRCEQCPSCDAVVKVKDIDDHRSLCELQQKNLSKVPCEHCEIKIPISKIKLHEENCGFRMEKCSICYDIMQANEIDSHRRSCEKTNIVDLPTTCPYCEIEFPSNDLDYHLVSCGAKIKECLSCLRTIKMRDFEDHKMQCFKIFGKLEDFSDTYQVEQAIEIESDHRPVPCEYCNEEFPLDLLELHMETCRELEEMCTTCNTLVKFRDKRKHKEKCMKPCDRLSQCPFCHVKFRANFVDTHLETCIERIENCKICDLPVMLRDKRKHKDTCEQLPVEEKCAICTLSFPKNELPEHFNKCVEDNTNNPYSECGMSLTLPTASSTENCKVSMRSEGIETNAYPSIGSLSLCPHCSTNYPTKRIKNHMKYCEKALRKCNICGDTYHIEEKEEHNMTCDALDNVLNKDNDFSIEVQNSFGALGLEENLRAKEKLNEKCPFCQNKIPEDAYSRHLQNCSQSIKVCSFCEVEFPKESEKEHLSVCPKLIPNKDEFLYDGFSRGQSKQRSFFENIKCDGCKKYIPPDAMDSHITSCRKLKNCHYCEDHISGNIQTHLTKCPAYKKSLKKSPLNNDTGAKPKKRNSQETESTFSKVFGSVKGFFSSSEKTNHSKYNDQQASYGATSANYHGKENLAMPSAPPEEDSLYMHCEFCNDKILMTQEAILIHESGCRPDLFSLPSARAYQQKSPELPTEVLSYDDDDEANAFQRGRRGSQKPENINITDDATVNTKDYTFIENFKYRYETQKDSSYKEAMEEKISRDNLRFKVSDVKPYSDKYRDGGVNVQDYEKDSRSKSAQEKIENKYKIHSNNELEYERKSQKNDKIKEKEDAYHATSYLPQSKRYTEPGEFLQNNLTYKESDLFSTENGEKVSSGSTVADNSDERNSSKLFHSWQKIDARNHEAYNQNIYNQRDNQSHSNNKNAQSIENQKKRDWVSSKESLNCTEDRSVTETKIRSGKVLDENASYFTDSNREVTGVIGIKTYSSKVLDKRASYYTDNNSEDISVIGTKTRSIKVLDKNASFYTDNRCHDSDPESSKDDNSGYGNKYSIQPRRKNVVVKESDEHVSRSHSYRDYKTDKDTFHPKYPSSTIQDKNTFSNDPQYDSEPESCKEAKDSHAYDDKYTKRTSRRNLLEAELRKHPNQDAFKTEDSSFFVTSEMQGPVKIDRLSVRKTDRKVKECLENVEGNKQPTAYKVKENIYPDVSSLKSTDFFDKDYYKEKSKLYKEMQQTTEADTFRDMPKNSSYKSCLEINTYGQEPMETDDDSYMPEKHSFQFSHSSRYSEVADSDTKDSNMDSYFEFLENEKDEPTMCRKCGNMVCVCNIEKSLSTSENCFSKERGTNPCSYRQPNDPSLTKDKSSEDRMANNQLGDQWKKYQLHFNDSD